MIEYDPTSHIQIRNRSRALNRYSVTIIRLDAAGAHLAAQLAILGVRDFVLIDAGVVRKADINAQGFHDDELGVAKVYAVADRLQKVRSSISVHTHAKGFKAAMNMIPESAVIVVADCTLSERRDVYERMLLQGRSPCVFDIRVSGDTFQCFCVPRDMPEVAHAYSKTLHAGVCPPAKLRVGLATTYTAAMAAGAACAMFEQWAKLKTGGLWHTRFDFNVRTFSVLHSETQP